jgi:putative transcriptional regulator
MRRLAQFRTARSSFRMRSIDGEKPRSLAGSLLVAHPSMLDPNFRRAVLFLSAHDPDDGALGVIINRPLDKNVADLVSEAPPEGLAKVPVFLGGPVGKHQLMFGAFEWHKGEGLKLNHDVGMDEANTLAGEDPLSICAFVGYAGWGAGQLEAEMKERAWIVHKPSRASFKPERLPRLWFDIMRGLGPWYKMLAAAPDDPSLN